LLAGMAESLVSTMLLAGSVTGFLVRSAGSAAVVKDSQYGKTTRLCRVYRLWRFYGAQLVAAATGWE